MTGQKCLWIDYLFCNEVGVLNLGRKASSADFLRTRALSL